MVELFIDKKNKVPLYLQLKDQIKYYVSTGALRAQERLPPVKTLAKNLSVNFQTIRKAYHELEIEGLVNIKHGDGTFITLDGSAVARQTSRANGTGAPATADLPTEFAYAIRELIEEYLAKKLDLAEARRIVERVFDDAERRELAPIVVFTECNQFQIKEISSLLERELALEVLPALISELSEIIQPLVEKNQRINVVTTGFHVNEVRGVIGALPVRIDVLITNLNPRTRRELEKVGERAKYSFICRDRESAVLYKDLLKAELGFRQMDLTACTLSETEKVQQILNSSDVVLVSPPVYEEVRRIAPPDKAVYNVFERVDPMSLKVIKDRILQEV
jgi:DNA-binding transcriptional regulator YhcF (GntR family)